MKTVFSFILDNIELLAAVCGGIIALLQWRLNQNNPCADFEFDELYWDKN